MNIADYKEYKSREFIYGSLLQVLQFMEHKSKDGNPRYIVIEAKLESNSFEVWATADHSKTDLDILIKEKLMMITGPDFPLTGYGFTSEKPIKIYKGVKIGRFKFRKESKHLPKYGALVRVGREQERIERHTIKEVQKRIDDLLLL